MQELQEAIDLTKRKLELLEQKEKLESEIKRLNVEVHKLKIIAHNEQADVDNLKMPGIRGLLLGISGKKQEVLEKEQAEARKAQKELEYAVANQASVRYRLDQCTTDLESLNTCEKVLGKLISFPDDDTLITLTRCAEGFSCLQQQISSLRGALTEVSQLSAIRNGTQSTSALSGTDSKLLAAERTAQSLLNQLKADIKCFVENVGPFGIVMDTDTLQGTEDDYLTDLYTYALITSRVEKIMVILRQLGFQMDTIKPQLEQVTLERHKAYIRILLDAAHKHLHASC